MPETEPKKESTDDVPINLENENMPAILVNGMIIGVSKDNVHLRLLYTAPKAGKSSVVGAFVLPLEVAKGIGESLTTGVSQAKDIKQ